MTTDYRGAPCAADPERWYPVSYKAKAALVDIAAVKSICDTLCPFKAQCFADAMTEESRDGIRAGLTPDERIPLFAERPLFIERPELDDAVYKRRHHSAERIADELEVSAAVVRDCRRRLAARKEVLA